MKKILIKAFIICINTGILNILIIDSKSLNAWRHNTILIMMYSITTMIILLINKKRVIKLLKEL